MKAKLPQIFYKFVCIFSFFFSPIKDFETAFLSVHELKIENVFVHLHIQIIFFFFIFNCFKTVEKEIFLGYLKVLCWYHTSFLILVKIASV